MKTDSDIFMHMNIYFSYTCENPLFNTDPSLTFTISIDS